MAAVIDFELAETVDAGLPTESLSDLKEKGMTFTEISETVIAPRTLKHRKARGERLSNDETDRLLRAMRVVSLAETVFGDHDKAMIWLRGADARIGGRAPIELLRTDAGGRVVEGMLWQIDEGVYS
jgi:putative toxin-antitoxin system antitoxin component (TIGR02293 family)